MILPLMRQPQRLLRLSLSQHLSLLLSLLAQCLLALDHLWLRLVSDNLPSLLAAPRK
jgi:hypothetical protein